MTHSEPVTIRCNKPPNCHGRHLVTYNPTTLEVVEYKPKRVVIGVNTLGYRELEKMRALPPDAVKTDGIEDDLFAKTAAWLEACRDAGTSTDMEFEHFVGCVRCGSTYPLPELWWSGWDDPYMFETRTP